VASEHDDEPTARRRPRRRRPRVPVRAVAFVGVLAAGVLIGWVLFGGDDGTRAPAQQATSTAPAGRQPRIVVDSRAFPRFGLSFGLPRGWRTRTRRGVLNAASADGSVSVAFSVAAGAGEGPAVRRSDRRQLTRLFRAREVSRERARIGNAPTIVTEFVGRTRRRQPIRILSMAVSSRWRTYSVQVFTVVAPRARRLLELRSLLSSVGYRQPR
jgi:hypothetical protein